MQFRLRRCDQKEFCFSSLTFNFSFIIHDLITDIQLEMVQRILSRVFISKVSTECHQHIYDIECYNALEWHQEEEYICKIQWFQAQSLEEHQKQARSNHSRHLQWICSSTEVRPKRFQSMTTHTNLFMKEGEKNGMINRVKGNRQVQQD